MHMNIETPEYLYKYYRDRDYNYEALKNNQIYMCSPLEFNDPYDSRFRISSGDKKQFLNCATKFLEKKGHNFAEDRVITASAKLGFPLHDIEDFYGYPNVSDLFYELFSHNDLNELYGFVESGSECTIIKSFLKFLNNLGLTSLSTNFEAPQMWSYYADDHKGFCVKYKVPKKTKNLLRVNYSCSPQPYFDKDNLSEDDLLNFTNLKSNHWEHESEFRLFTTAGRNVLVDNPLEPVAVCTGFRMSSDSINNIYDCFPENIEKHYSLLCERGFRIRWIKENTCFL